MAGLMLVVVLPAALVVAAIAYTCGAVQRAARGRIFSDPMRAPSAECAVVLGCAPTLGDGRPNFYFEARLDAAARLYAAGRVRWLIVSGGVFRAGGELRREPDAMLEGLVARGVPAERVLLDALGTRTRASAERAYAVFGMRHVVFVSQAFHAPRAIYLGRRTGLDACAHTAVSPSRSSRKHMAVLFREVLACTRAVFETVTTKKSVPEC